MKRSLHKSLVVLPLVVVCTVFSASAQAQSVPIQGKMINTSCTPGFTTPAVFMADVKATDIPNVGDTSDIQGWQINLFCDDNPNMTLKVYFYADHVTNGRLNITSGIGSGWQYQIVDGNSGVTQVDVKTSPIPSDNPNDPGKFFSTKSGFILYGVRYYRSEQNITPGNGSTTVNLAVFYL